MDKGNVLGEGMVGLERLREKLIRLEEYKAEQQEADLAEQDMEQQIGKKEQEIAEEIKSVIEAREREIAKSYDEQIKRQKSRRQKAQDDKLKKKNKKVRERIAEETAQLQEDNKKLSEEASYLFRKNKVASVYNNRFYYAMFMPKGAGDILIALGAVLVWFAAVPRAAYLFMAPENAMLFWVVAYAIVTVIFAGAYYISYSVTKKKASEAVWMARELNVKIRKNNRQIKKISRAIKKDKDESGYGLSSYDKEIKKLEEKEREIELEKAAAIAALKNTTSIVLASEVQSSHEAEVSKLKNSYEAQKEKTHYIEEKIRELTFDLANHYQAYLGAEFMDSFAAGELIAIMKESEVSTISEALGLYREKKRQSETESTS